MELRLVDFPEEFEAPPDTVLAQLREIDSDAELVCVGPGRWWAGRVVQFAGRRDKGRRELARLEHDDRKKDDPSWWPKIRNAILASQGFGPVCKHYFPGGQVHWSLLVEDFRYRIWWYLQYQEGDEEIRIMINGLLDEDIRSRARAALVESGVADPAYLFKKIVRQNPAPVPVGVNL